MRSAMTTTDMRMLVSSRYSGDIELLRAIRKEASLMDEHKRVEVLRQRSRMRMRLLATAVRVSEGMLPNVANSMSHIAARVDVGKPLEAFVFADADVNAFVCEGSSRFLVGLSSGAVETLTADELEFVIGHELGHALFGHTEVAAGHLVESGRLTSDHSKLLRAWQRSSEISADRVGLLCCEGHQLLHQAGELVGAELVAPALLGGFELVQRQGSKVQLLGEQIIQVYADQRECLEARLHCRVQRAVGGTDEQAAPKQKADQHAFVGTSM